MKISITGSYGQVGRILVENLSEDFTIKELDLPEVDLTNFEQVLENLEGSESVIHLAWDTEVGDSDSDKKNDSNYRMAKNVFEACLENGINKVVVASSLHVSEFKLNGKLIKPYDKTEPETNYGRSRVAIEKLGKDYSQKGLKVVILRLGRVRYDEAPEDRFPENILLLKNSDLLDLVEKILRFPELDEDFVIVQAVPDCSGRRHSFENPFGWKPSS